MSPRPMRCWSTVEEELVYNMTTEKSTADSTRIHDPKTYKEMAVPYATLEEGQAALHRFAERVREVRRECRIPEVMVTAFVYVKDRDEHGALNELGPPKGLPMYFTNGDPARIIDLLRIARDATARERVKALREEADAIEREMIGHEVDPAGGEDQDGDE